MMRIDTWYLACLALDMRCGMDTLLARVIAIFGQAAPHTAYAFTNQRATRMKVLVHDGFGLWLCTRRLHQGCLHWPRHGDQPLQLSPEQWHALTIGLPWKRVDSPITLA